MARLVCVMCSGGGGRFRPSWLVACSSGENSRSQERGTNNNLKIATAVCNKSQYKACQKGI